MRRNDHLLATLRSFALSIPLALLPIAVAHCQMSRGTEKSDELAGPDPRLDFEAEAVVPGVAPDKVRNVIRNDKTLLTVPDGPWQPVDTEHKALQLLASELATTRAELKRTQELVGDVLKGHRRVNDGSDLPPLPDAEVRVFQMQHTSANDAADKIKRLIGTQPIRVAVDEASNGVIVFGKAEALPQVEQLIIKLDELSVAKTSDASRPFINLVKEPAAKRRTLMLRVFWLADGLPEDEGTQIEGIHPEFFPDSVRYAVGRLGIHNARLVAQTVISTSSSVGGEPVLFSSEVPAILFQRSATLTAVGSLSATADDRAEVDIQLAIGGVGVNSELKGSLTMPIGHFMILGTTNAVIPKLEVGGGGGGFGEEAPSSASQSHASQYAFIVQVAEAESFATEKKAK